MLFRIVVAVIWIPVLLLVIFVLPPFALPCALAILAAVGAYELLWRTSLLRNMRMVLYSMAISAAIPIWVYCGANGTAAVCGLLLYMILLFAESMANLQNAAFEKIGLSFFAGVVIPFFLASFVRLDLRPEGKYIVLLPFIAAFSSDAVALFAGMLFGRRKLAPSLSPKKTVEGAIGGFVGGIAMLLLYGLLVQVFFFCQVNYPLLAVYGLLGSVFSQFGDLAFSYIKRECQIKDYGNIFPGHGGVLDRFDSVIFCAPLFELLVNVLPAIYN